MDFSRLNRGRVVVGAAPSVAADLSILFLPWYSLDNDPQRAARDPGRVHLRPGDYSCTGFEPSRSFAGCCCSPRSPR